MNNTLSSRNKTPVLQYDQNNRHGRRKKNEKSSPFAHTAPLFVTCLLGPTQRRPCCLRALGSGPRFPKPPSLNTSGANIVFSTLWRNYIICLVPWGPLSLLFSPPLKPLLALSYSTPHSTLQYNLRYLSSGI